MAAALTLFGNGTRQHRAKAPRFTRFIYVAAAGAILTAAAMGAIRPAAADTITVVVDRAKILRLTEPAGTIILGNPAIADATMSDDRTLILTGKSYGATNLVILDDNGEQIADETLLVRGPSDGIVAVYKGVHRETMTCAPYCERTATVGDKTDVFEQFSTQTKIRNGFSQSVATGKAAAAN